MTRAKQLFRQAKSNDFIRNNGIYFVGSLAFAAINYLYYPILGRITATNDFGEVQVILSLYAEVTILLSVISNVVTNVVANERDEDLARRTTFELERFTTLVMLGLLILATLAGPLVKSFLNFPGYGTFVALAVTLIVSVPQAMRTAYLRGKSAFGIVSIAQIVGGLLKIAASVVLVLLGFGAVGAIAGLAVSQYLSYLYARHRAMKLGLTAHPGDRLVRRLDLSLIKPQLGYTVLVLIVSLATTIQFSFDVLVVKHYFDARTAGLYAGVATIGRIIYFLTGSFAFVLLSNVRRDQPLAANRRLLVRSALLQIVIGGVALIIFALAPKLIITILLGHRYVPLANLLPELSLALFIIAFNALLLNYDMALRRWSAAVVAIVGTGATVTMVAMHHASPQAVVTSILTGSIVMFGLRGLDSVRRRVMPGDLVAKAALEAVPKRSL